MSADGGARSDGRAKVGAGVVVWRTRLMRPGAKKEGSSVIVIPRHPNPSGLPIACYTET